MRPYAPGDYGFLDAPTLPGPDEVIIDAVARVQPAACFRRSAVNIRPGAIVAVRDAFNVRKNGATTLLATNQSVNAAGTYTSYVTLQNAPVAVGDYLELIIPAGGLVGAVTMVAVQIVVSEAD